MGTQCGLFAGRLGFSVGVGHFEAGMLIIVAIYAEQFPVATVGRIVVVIMVLMVDRKLSQPFPLELSTAAATNPGE